MKQANEVSHSETYVERLIDEILIESIYYLLIIYSYLLSSVHLTLVLVST